MQASILNAHTLLFCCWSFAATPFHQGAGLMHEKGCGRGSGRGGASSGFFAVMEHGGGFV